MKRFTKLQREFIDEGNPAGSYTAFPNAIFKSDAYKQWKRKRRAKILKSQQHSDNTDMASMPE